MANNTHREPAIQNARGTTDNRLRSERKQTDRILERKLIEPEQRADEKVDAARSQADALLQRATEEAGSVASSETRPAVALGPVLDREQRRLETAIAAHEARDVAQQAVEKAKTVAEAAIAAERAKAEAAVEKVAERAEEALNEERVQVDEATQRERKETKRAFLEVLANERRETDMALHSERSTSDSLVDSRDEVLATISHDLRNLVGTMRLRLARLAGALPEHPDQAQQLASDMQRNCEVMERWAGDLVDVATVEAGALRLERELESPLRIADESVKAFLPIALEKGVELDLETCGESPRVLCDRDRIVQVMSNLLSNATKFTPAGGRIVVRCEPVGDDVQFSVSDSGPGIEDADRARIFERRWHTDMRKGGGVGLGLYISKRIVESHGGRIWVQKAEPQGSAFYFTLPAQKA